LRAGRLGGSGRVTAGLAAAGGQQEDGIGKRGKAQGHGNLPDVDPGMVRAGMGGVGPGCGLPCGPNARAGRGPGIRADGGQLSGRGDGGA
ncbi:hypothetical protein COK69_26890, partial [Bacillus cereus]